MRWGLAVVVAGSLSFAACEDPPEVWDEARCFGEIRNIQAAIDALDRGCSSDTECGLVRIADVCPFDCVMVVREETDLSSIEARIREYGMKNCPPCLTTCVNPVSAKCVAGACQGVLPDSLSK